MPKTYEGNIFTAQHHALLFTSISREVINNIGEKNGEKLIRKAVRKYGQQRGKRMALRAKKNGHDLTVANYFAYGEASVRNFISVPQNPSQFQRSATISTSSDKRTKKPSI